MMETKKPLSGLMSWIVATFVSICFVLFLPDALGAVTAVQITTLAVAMSFPTVAGFDFDLAFMAAALTSALLAVLAAGLRSFLGWDSAEGLRGGVLGVHLSTFFSVPNKLRHFLVRQLDIFCAPGTVSAEPLVVEILLNNTTASATVGKSNNLHITNIRKVVLACAGCSRHGLISLFIDSQDYKPHVRLLSRVNG
jgi:uncharacterized integral membrane protein